jgi:hypothetical protein
MEKTTEKVGEPEVEEFELGGVTCSRWFDAEGRLHVSGPAEVQKQIDEYIEEFARLSAGGKPVLLEDTIKPLDIESLPIKQRAILEVLAEEADKALDAGIEEPEITITADQVKAKVKQLRLMNRKR